MKKHGLSMKLVAAALGTAALIAAAAPAAAATANTTFAVQMTITASCIFQSATTLNFGSSGVIAANVDQTTTFSMACTNSTPYTLGLDAGTGAGATVAVRKMTNGGNTIDYSLYSDAGRTTVWGNTIGINTVAGTGNGATQVFTVYGRVPTQTTPAPAAYSDTITVTVTY